MKISILTPDSKMPNLAAMKISSYWKSQGASVELNFPLIKADVTYASILFNWTDEPICDFIGGPRYPEIKLPDEIEYSRPDYDIYPSIDYSVGYTYKPCPRTCSFCVVPKQCLDDKHYSIWDFHEKRFNKICLMNNNTFADPNWRDTFNEINDAKLTVIDRNGYDLRLIGEEQAMILKRTKFENSIHAAWDFIDHENEIIEGMNNLKKAGLNRITVYVLIGYDSTETEDYHRVMKIHEFGYDPFVMPYNKHNNYQKRFARWCNHKAIFKTVAWKDYRG